MDPAVWESRRARTLTIPKPDRRIGQWTPYKLLRKYSRKIKGQLRSHLESMETWKNIVSYPTIAVSVGTNVTYATTNTTGWQIQIQGVFVRPETTAIWQTWSTGGVSWNAPTAADPYTTGVWQSWNHIRDAAPPPPPTHAQLVAEAQQRQAQEEANRRWQEEEKKRNEQHILAQGRAEQLLRIHLSHSQYQEWEQHKRVVVQKGKKRYVLNGNGAEVADEEGNLLEHVCIHLYGNYPQGDMLLAQLLMLEHDELEFLRIGNRTPAYAARQRILPALRP